MPLFTLLQYHIRTPADTFPHTGEGMKNLFYGQENRVRSGKRCLSHRRFGCLHVQESQSEAARLTILQAKIDYLAVQDWLFCKPRLTVLDAFRTVFDGRKIRQEIQNPHTTLNVSDIHKKQKNGGQSPRNRSREGATHLTAVFPCQDSIISTLFRMADCTFLTWFQEAEGRG